MDKRRRRRNGTEFSHSIQQSNTMKVNKNKVSLQRRKQKKDTRKSKRGTFEEHTM